MTTPSKIFVEVAVTNNEFIKVLTQLGYRSELTEERYRFVNDKHDTKYQEAYGTGLRHGCGRVR